MSGTFQHIGIIGGGAWGTALAMAMRRACLRQSEATASARQASRDVLLWAYENDVVNDINRNHENKIFLPGVKLDAKIKATNNLADLAACDIWLLVTPAQHTREIAKQLVAAAGTNKAPVVICAKGIEEINPKLMSEAVSESLPHHTIAVLSGPSFAIEVARDLPTALTLAIKDKALGEKLVQAIGAKHLRLYLSDDIVGAQIGGAVKNVLAVAAGIAIGCKMGDNGRAAIITRGLAELMRLGVAMGGKAETLMGLSGLGDLVLTCSSMQSRNMSLGVALGEGKSLKEILGSRAGVTEGVYTAAAAKALAKKYNVEMPIVAAVDGVLNNGAKLEDTIEALLARPMKAEH